MAGERDRDMWDRFDLELFCQHCGQYLTWRVGIERKDLDAARAEARREAQAHARRRAGRRGDVLRDLEAHGNHPAAND